MTSKSFFLQKYDFKVINRDKPVFRITILQNIPQMNSNFIVEY